MLHQPLLDLHAASLIREFLPAIDDMDIERELKDDIEFIAAAFTSYLSNSYIPTSIHLELINRYCRSNGLAYQIFTELLGTRLFHKSIFFRDDLGTCLPPDISPESILCWINQLATNGYTNTYQLFTADLCERLLRSINTMKTSALMPNGKYVDVIGVDGLQESDQYVLVNVGMRELLKNPIISEALLNMNPMTALLPHLAPYQLRLVSGRLCLSYPSTHDQQDEAAQSWHFDLDGIGFIKQFIYLNNVDESNGAHMYIPGTHKAGFKDQRLLSRGYARISDSDMSLMQSREPVQVTGLAGSSFFGSTLCWHKGGVVSGSYRAMIILEYSVSKFQLKVR